MSATEVFDALEPVLTLCRNLDFVDPDEAEAWLEEAFPHAGPAMQQLRALCARGLAEGWLCKAPGPDGARATRVAEPSGPEQTCSLDVCLYEGAASAPSHRHPAGEVNLVYALDPGATLDGRGDGWVVHAEGSEHAPAAMGGRVLALVIRPHGAVEHP